MIKFFKVFCLSAILLFIFLGISSVLAQATIELPNPLGPQKITENVLYKFAGTIVNGFVGVTGSIALLMFVYGGFIWLTSRGEPDKIKKGKGIFIWSVVGLMVIFSSYFLVAYILQSLQGSSSERCCVKQVGTTYQCRPISQSDEKAVGSCTSKDASVINESCNLIKACPAQ